MKLNHDEILKIQKNVDPFLMIDEITEVIPGSKIHAFKNMDADLWFFKIHWKGDPNMPASLQMESMTQASALILQTIEEYKNKLIYVAKVKEASFINKVVPGKKLEIFSEIKNFKRGIAECEAYTKIETMIASRAKFTIIIPEILNSFKVK